MTTLSSDHWQVSGAGKSEVLRQNSAWANILLLEIVCFSGDSVIYLELGKTQLKLFVHPMETVLFIK